MLQDVEGGRAQVNDASWEEQPRLECALQTGREEAGSP